jgi:Domain of unknown function (DUF4249)
MMKKIILAIATIAIFISCEKTVIVDVPVAAPKLVVNGIVQANNVFAVNVGKSEAVLSSTGANSFKVTNATVQLYENGLLKDSFLYNSTNNNYVAKNGTLALTGKTYKHCHTEYNKNCKCTYRCKRKYARRSKNKICRQWKRNKLLFI